MNGHGPHLTNGHGVPTVVVAGIQPAFGPITGGTRVMILVHGLAAFHAGVRVFFNVYVKKQRDHGLGMLTMIRREATAVQVGNNCLTCNAPPGDVIGPVPVHVVVPNRNTRYAVPGTEYPIFIYASELPAGMDLSRMTIQSQAGNQAEYKSSHAGPSSDQSQPQASHQNGINGTGSVLSRQVKHRQCPSMSTMSDVDTPPSYEDVKAADRENQYLQTKMMLCAVGAALEEKAANTSEDVEPKPKVKGLASDLKLWLVWIPLLVIVLAAMVNSNIYPIREFLSSVMYYVGNRVFGSACTA